MLAYVIKAELREDYKIYIEFNDGLSGIIDFRDKITTDHREIIRELVDKNKFNKIKVERHTLCWENGVDFAPEYLYDQIKIRQKTA
jgi:Mg/Co/Ni transporter MgtE